MNRKYVIFYALILAAMAGILIVGLFDWRFLDSDGPIPANMPNRRPSPPAATSRATNYHGGISSSGTNSTQQVTKTNLHEKLYSEDPTNRESAADCDWDRLSNGSRWSFRGSRENDDR